MFTSLRGPAAWSRLLAAGALLVGVATTACTSPAAPPTASRVEASAGPAIGRPSATAAAVLAASPKASSSSPPAAHHLPAPTRASTPAPTATPSPKPFEIDLYRQGDFVSQARVDWCVPAAILTMVNLIEPRPPGAVSAPAQARLDRLARSLSSDRLVGAGSEPEGWAGALNELGYGRYEVRAERTMEAALEVAARALRATERPVGLLMWRGAHAWVMSGFEATADPAATATFDVTHVRIEDPWHPRKSSIWGPAQKPNTRISVTNLAEDFLPWRRPTVRYPEKDGRFVVVVPIRTTG